MGATNSTTWQQSLSGLGPLNGVDLRAVVSGTATGTINYYFYCNRIDGNTNITGDWFRRYLAVNFTTKQEDNISPSLCNYSIPGTYYAKVIVERGPLAREDRVMIVVTAPPLSVNLTAHPATGTNPLDSYLRASVAGETGVIDYYFWWNCTNTSSNVNRVSGTCGTLSTPLIGQCRTDIAGKGYRCRGRTNEIQDTPLHQYTPAGVYTGKVIAERNGEPEEDRTSVTVTTPTPTPTPTPTATPTPPPIPIWREVAPH